MTAIISNSCKIKKIFVTMKYKLYSFVARQQFNLVGIIINVHSGEHLYV